MHLTFPQNIFHMKWISNIWRKIGMDYDRRMEGSVRWKQSGWTGSRYTHIGKKSPQLFCSTGAKARNILRIQNKKTIHLVWKCKNKVTGKLQTPANPCSGSTSTSATFPRQKTKDCSQRSYEGSSINLFLFRMHATQIFHVSWCQTISSFTPAFFFVFFMLILFQWPSNSYKTMIVQNRRKPRLECGTLRLRPELLLVKIGSGDS